MTTLTMEPYVEIECVYSENNSECLVTPGELRQSDVIAALSRSLDLTEGQPAGHAIRGAMIGMRLAKDLQLPAADRSALFYALLLKDLGCSSNAAKMAWLFSADDRRVKRDLKTVDWTKMTAKASFVMSHIAPGAGPLQKALTLAAMAREGDAGAVKLVETRCERGAELARSFQLPEATALAIRSLDEQWNGKGHPSHLRGEEIPLFSRILNLAQTVEVFLSTQGLNAALSVARSRRGTWFDPALVDLLLATKRDENFWRTVRRAGGYNEAHAERGEAWEPEDVAIFADNDQLDRIAAGFAEVVDAKSPWTYKHSTGVAEIAAGIAERLGFSSIRMRDLRRAGLLHDLGKLGVSNTILDKPGKPTDDEFAEIRKHPSYSEAILMCVPAFRRLADVASAHHERLDGRGYHRRLPGQTLPLEARILAVADVYEALTAKRPYRDGMPREKALGIMRKDAGAGLCPECLSALEQWLDRTTVTPRVAAQLDAIERLHASL